ncbi:MAG TPA: MlaD family protein [Terriglobales bacterium]|nr:MlaD family protein [Terriglobales bacterium]
MPSQQELRWSQLRVGITVIVASLVLAVLIFLMSGTAGIFTKKLTLRAYFQSGNGLRVGAPVTLQGVTIGNVKEIRIVPERKNSPVEVVMKIAQSPAVKAVKKDSKASLSSAGVLGDLFVDIDSKTATGPDIQDGDELKAEGGSSSIEDVVKAGQGTLQNMDVLLKRMDRILASVENGEGSVGKIIKDPALFNKASALITQMQDIVDGVSKGKGSIGKLLSDDELYRKINTSVDKLNKIVDDLNAGKGNAGKFLKDEELYKNANETIAKANKLMDDVNAGRGTLGKFAKDEEFAKKIDNITTNLSLMSTRLEAGEGSVGKLMRDPSLYNNADQMLVETRNLVKAIRENPKKYLTIHFKLF